MHAESKSCLFSPSLVPKHKLLGKSLFFNLGLKEEISEIKTPRCVPVKYS